VECSEVPGSLHFFVCRFVAVPSFRRSIPFARRPQQRRRSSFPCDFPVGWYSGALLAGFSAPRRCISVPHSLLITALSVPNGVASVCWHRLNPRDCPQTDTCPPSPLSTIPANILRILLHLSRDYYLYVKENAPRPRPRKACCLTFPKQSTSSRHLTARDGQTRHFFRPGPFSRVSNTVRAVWRPLRT
jgi:hypothetical protein